MPLHPLIFRLPCSFQYYEASHDPAAITCILNYFAEARRRLATVPLQGWAQSRGQDMILGIQWLVDNFEGLLGVPPGFNQVT